jgi:hypothetical protein
MPLRAGASKGIVGENIREMVANGHSPRVAVAAALHNADKYRSQGGIVGVAEAGQSYAGGGTVGFLHSPVPGRTDLIHAAPAAGSYVVPADIVSGIGEGNSNAGAALLQKALAMGPIGMPLPMGVKRRAGPPPPPPRYSGQLLAPAALKQGGRANNEGVPTPILAAGGEFIIPADVVRTWGGGDLKKGHDALDAWVVSKRREIAKEMLHLKGPKKR